MDWLNELVTYVNRCNICTKFREKRGIESMSVTHEQIVNSGRMQFLVFDAKSNMFRRDFDTELVFTRDGYNRLWEARHA